MPEKFSPELMEALPDIEGLARKMWKDHGGRLRQGPEMIDDLISAGVVAFLEAMEGYDPDKGTSPMQYAYKRVYGAMIDAVRAAPLVGSTTNGLGVTVSLDEFIGNGKTARRIDLLTSDEDDEEEERSLVRDAMLASVNKAIEGLTDREKQIVEGLFLKDKTGKEVGRELDVDGSRISQLKRGILVKLRAALTAMDDENVQGALKTPGVTEYIVGEDGVVELPNGRKVIAVYVYADHIGRDPDTLLQTIKGIGIRPIKGVVGKRSANSRGLPGRLYPKDAVDRHTIRACQLDANGITTLPDGREAVCIEPYGRYIERPSLGKMVGTHRLKPVYEFVGRSLRSEGKRGRMVKLYPREAVDLLVEILQKSPRRRPKR